MRQLLPRAVLLRHAQQAQANPHANNTGQCVSTRSSCDCWLSTAEVCAQQRYVRRAHCCPHAVLCTWHANTTDYPKIAAEMPNRTAVQVNGHAQAYFRAMANGKHLRLMKDP